MVDLVEMKKRRITSSLGNRIACPISEREGIRVNQNSRVEAHIPALMNTLITCYQRHRPFCSTNRTRFVRVEVSTAVTVKNAVFWPVAPRGSCKSRQIASIIRVTGIGELGTTLAVTGNRSTLRRNTVDLQVPHGVTSQETSLLKTHFI
jgi:hypothetical protein